MWIKIDIFPSDNEVVFLPSALASDLNWSGIIKFGAISVDTKILYTDKLEYIQESTFENPNIIRFSNKLRDKLLLPESQVYRAKINDNNIVIGPVIGLLLGMQTHRYNPKHMMKYSDRFGLYDKIGGLIYAFSPKSINFSKHIAYGLYYNIETKAWEYGCFPLPEVIYRRNFHSSPKVIKRLIEVTGDRLFNSFRFTKYELYDFINLDTELREFLPPTERLTGFEQLTKFIDCHSRVILKPVDLSRGRGICIVEKNDKAYKIIDYRYKQPIISVLGNNEALEGFYYINQNLFNNYIIQKYIPLAKLKNSLFDIRIVMQKTKDKRWACSGIECRISGENSHITNISRGGYALPLEEALRQAFNTDYELLPQRIQDFCQKFCIYMDTMGKHFSEFGIDLAVDVDKNIWLIEANVFPSFKGFKTMDRETYLQIRHAPLEYALSLTPFGEQGH